ncbi:MAG: bifunctional UDP-N-acetylglucosamine diphosphorylase/glucosamine-1-phosphate N-acetyltransferase GlmU [Chloroflexota bacterium]
MTVSSGDTDLAVVILAAGSSTRFHSSLVKVLHPLAGRPMIVYSVDLARSLGVQQPVLVVGNDADRVREYLGDRVAYVEQSEQLGTGHAVMQAHPALAGRSRMVLVLYGDMPLQRAETLRRLVALHRAGHAPVTMLTVLSDDSMGFGRILRDPIDHRILGIVEEAVATPEQLAIRELNTGAYCFQAEWLWQHLPRIRLRPKGEYYLTDLIEMAVSEGHPVQALTIDDVTEVVGINTRAHLAWAEAILRHRINERWMLAGVTLVDPDTTYIEADVTIGQDTLILPGTHLKGQTVIGRDCIIGPHTWIQDATLGAGCVVRFSVVERATLEDDVDVGPFAHLRQGAHLAQGVHMGNFGEVKNAYLGSGTKMGHFSYLGDAVVGRDVNIGAGTITCNYDGQNKHQTLIGDGAFIGSDTMLVAPVEIGERSKTGAGSVVTHDVPPDSVVYGVPARRRPSEE